MVTSLWWDNMTNWQAELNNLNAKINSLIEELQRKSPELQCLLGQRHIITQVIKEQEDEKNADNTQLPVCSE